MTRLGPFGMLLAFVAVLSASNVAYVVTDTPPSDTFDRLASVGWGQALLVWVVVDAHKRRQTPCFDFGVLVAVFLPVALIWYVFWSRGWRGLWMLAAVVGLTMLPWLCAVATWILKYGLP